MTKLTIITDEALQKYRDALAENERLRSQIQDRGAWVFDPDDWEYTMPWEDRDQLAASCEVEHQGIKRFKTLIDGPDKFCVRVDGEYCWFDTKAEAEAAWKAELAREDS